MEMIDILPRYNTMKCQLQSMSWYLTPKCGETMMMKTGTVEPTVKLKFVACKTTGATSYMHRAPRVKGHMEMVLIETHFVHPKVTCKTDSRLL